MACDREGLTLEEWTRAARLGRARTTRPTDRERAAWSAGNDPTEWARAYTDGTEPLPH